MQKAKLLGENIKRYRLRQHLSQEKLAELTDLSREHVAYVERGLKKISLKKLYAIVDALGIKCSDLFDFD